MHTVEIFHVKHIHDQEYASILPFTDSGLDLEKANRLLTLQG